ncbi:MAG: hypothetical protein F2574_01745 [Actinobacteria bacterium]|uniref:Unannotated protein n=1 Tax=freshwater metagenome TaxID=449393 RepID=A0A6J6FL99_9ZZZZ|nr:hypothetical protein [Actinomycetota bacterium]
MASTHTPESVTPAAPQLDATDRCDSCGAQAYVRVRVQSGELFFCAHHAAAVRDALQPTALEWHDESDRLRTEHGA